MQETSLQSLNKFGQVVCLEKLLTHGRTHGRWTTDKGPSQKLTLNIVIAKSTKICIANTLNEYI
jgi:hypothetical protein